MPSRLSNGAATTTTMTRSRFELPALDLNFGSITDGTNIPPPPASPVQRVPTPPQTPPPAGKNEKVISVTNAVEKKLTSTPPNGKLAGTKRSADEAPLSPAGSGHQGSIRRLFSRNMLNASYTDGRMTSMGTAPVANGARPESRGAASLMDDRKSKRSSGWFRRLRGGDYKRSSVIFDDATSLAVATPRQAPSGPPPPMIPELAEFEKDEGGLGGDMFKNIK